MVPGVAEVISCAPGSGAEDKVEGPGGAGVVSSGSHGVGPVARAHTATGTWGTRYGGGEGVGVVKVGGAEAPSPVGGGGHGFRVERAGEAGGKARGGRDGAVRAWGAGGGSCGGGYSETGVARGDGEQGEGSACFGLGGWRDQADGSVGKGWEEGSGRVGDEDGRRSGGDGRGLDERGGRNGRVDEGRGGEGPLEDGVGIVDGLVEGVVRLEGGG